MAHQHQHHHSSPNRAIHQESDLIEALGISDMKSRNHHEEHSEGIEEDEYVAETYQVVPDPSSEAVDLSKLRGVASGGGDGKNNNNDPDNDSNAELENLAELVPDIKSRARVVSDGGPHHNNNAVLHHPPSNDHSNAADDDDAVAAAAEPPERKMSLHSGGSTDARRLSVHSVTDYIQRNESIRAQQSRELDVDDTSKVTGGKKAARHDPIAEDYQAEDEASSGASRPDEDDSLDDYPNSDLALEEENEEQHDQSKIPKEFMNSGQSVAQSISTATQTHEVRMPMYLPTFKPATGCTNASDFIVRCFVARLRSGITVVKHGRSRWCKSRLRVLHLHPDGRSLSWKPAEGEPASSRRPPKLDLSTCLEVRHAWSPDPQNPMYTGTPILRQKCEAANAHKSFALIFKQRTVDITAVTADQCKVLMEGFSALCFRLQVANMAGRSGAKKAHSRPMPEEDGVSTTASATLTNSSTPRGR